MKPGAVASRLAAFLPAELRRTRRALKGAGRRNPDEPVHEARKSIKKLRAALRLARKMAPKKALAAVGDPLRKAAHALGPLRDHLVLQKAAQDLAKPGEEEPPPPEAPDEGPLLQQARAELSRAASGMRYLLKAGFDEKGAEAGLRRIYKRAGKAMKKARASNSDEDLHAWRRRAKDLYYVLEMIEAPAGCIQKMKRLTELLGDDHDLAAFALAHGSATARRAHREIFKRARKRRRALGELAFRLGPRLLDGDEHDFVRRLLD